MLVVILGELEMKISEMTDQQLQNEYVAYYEMIYRVECYGTRDLIWFYAIEEKEADIEHERRHGERE